MLFTTVVSRIDVSFAKATAFLTFFTLFFGELLPKVSEAFHHQSIHLARFSFGACVF